MSYHIAHWSIIVASLNSAPSGHWLVILDVSHSVFSGLSGQFPARIRYNQCARDW